MIPTGTADGHVYVDASLSTQRPLADLPALSLNDRDWVGKRTRT